MNEHPTARADVVSRPLGDDEWALYDPRSEQVHALNVSAAAAVALFEVVRQRTAGSR